MRQEACISNSPPDATTAQRFEMKYLVDETRARSLAAFIQPFVQRDRHAQNTIEYPVNTLYLDSPDFKTYRSSMCGERNRFKLRVRTYGENGNYAYFIEIKRRIDQVVKKERAALTAIQPGGLWRFLASRKDTGSIGSESDDLTLYRFRNLVRILDARPMTWVTYMREPYVGAFGEPLRITFDRHIACIPQGWNGGGPPSSSRSDFEVLLGMVVVEVKFTGAFPKWIERAIRSFDLQRHPVCKYALGLSMLRQRGVPLDTSNEDVIL